jgi:hypothetical protein
MPGFIVGGKGTGPNHTVETRRRHRWIFRTLGKGSSEFASEVLLILKEASRPQFNFEEPVMHHNQEQAYFAGKQTWEAVKLVWYDGEQNPDISKEMWEWVNTVCNIPAVTVDIPGNYKKQGKLQMLDGAGTSTETWQMYGCWPQSTNWNNLDYSDTEIQTIEVTMRYDRAERQ